MVFARCPYCYSTGWDYVTYSEPIRRDTGKGGLIEYGRAVCHECENEFMVKDSYEFTDSYFYKIIDAKSNECMTMVEFEKGTWDEN